MYLKEHCPDLYESMGMIRLPNGRKVLKRSYDRYSEAIRLFSTTTEPLRSIADRLKIQYNSIGGFIRRNYPELIEEHNRLVEDGKKSRREKRENENTREAKEMQDQERERIISALRQTDGNRIKAAALLGISKSTLYNRLRSLGIR